MTKSLQTTTMNTGALPLPKEVESQTRVRFPDCDPFGHLNNSKYIDYIINAREDQLLKKYHFDIHAMVRQTGTAWVVAQTQIAYLLPVDLMEVVTIQTRLLSYSTKALVLEAVMWDENKSHVKAVMWTKQAHYHLPTKKSHEQSAELMAFFGETHYPIESNPSFEARVKSLKQTNFEPQNQA